jgi:glutamate/tyrosine decarboxylase-like PLP-dependent enzyme
VHRLASGSCLADEVGVTSAGVDEPTDQLTDLLRQTSRATAAYRGSLAARAVAPPVDRAALRAAFGGDLPTTGSPPADVIEHLIAAADPGLVATAGPRFFGFVVGGSLPSAMAADLLAVGWDQMAFNAVSSPAAAVAEEVAGGWLKELLGIPSSASVGFVTGAQAANTVGLATGRHHVLAGAGWDVEQDGLLGGPPVRVVASVERHATIDRSLRLLGFGNRAVEPVRTDSNGAIDVDDLRRVLGTGPAAPTLVCLQAGNVNTGACDNLAAATAIAHNHGSWVHVDGAFGLWAAANPGTRRLVDGVELADSWACDGHKWLNVPYDSGFVFSAHPIDHAAAASYTAAYLEGSGAVPSPSDFVLESSRRARGFAVWAALRELGRDGVGDLVERCCRLARRFAEGLSGGGAQVVNDVVLNQVLVSFGSDTRTAAVIEAVQRDGTCWLGGSTWRGQKLMRVSVSNWSTTQEDVDRSVAAILKCADALPE